ncbi:hypothetical protein BH20BAC1_BH20BAC1_13260 [soil metagenome]
MSQQPFKKFINKKKNAAVKEQHKQEKKIAKKVRAEAIEKRYQQKRLGNDQQASTGITKAVDRDQKQKNHDRPLDSSQQKKPGNVMPLNKYLAHCGLASRRNAISLVASGKITVNNKTITEPGFKVNASDEVRYSGKRIFITKDLVYILLNKPKDYITTSDDPQNRKTVIQLVKNATDQRIYPIGRLDRNTSGVLLLTNDGDLTQKLTHPKFEVKKLYEVKLDRPLVKSDFEKIINGIQLEDGEIHPDARAYADSKDKSVIGIELHSGRNRLVRRIFESLGYNVMALDRVMYSSLTKKNVQRGKWRYLSEAEVRSLKYLTKNRKKEIKQKG